MILRSWRMFGQLLAIAMVVSGVFVLNAYVTHQYTGQEQPFDWFFELSTNISSFIVWAALVPLILAPVIARDWPWRISLKSLVFWVSFGLAVSAFHRASALTVHVISYYFYTGTLLNLFGVHSLFWIIRGTIPSLLQFGVIVFALRALYVHRENMRRLVELERVRKELATAELNMLKGQMQPHFIFNTLNTIASVMDRNTEAAQEIITRLASLMRSFLESDRKQFVSLETELEHVRDYVDIEAARFSDRLVVEWVVEREVLPVAVPNMLLQPLVENAIKHGFSSQVKGGVVSISAKRVKDELLLSVSDDGVGAASAETIDSANNQGLGLRSVRARLDALYGNAASLVVVTAPQQGFAVHINLPLKQGEGS